jgi:hypothetical protein
MGIGKLPIKVIPIGLVNKIKWRKKIISWCITCIIIRRQLFMYGTGMHLKLHIISKVYWLFTGRRSAIRSWYREQLSNGSSFN